MVWFRLLLILLLAVPVMADDYLDSLRENYDAVKYRLNWDSTTSAETNAHIAGVLREAYSLISVGAKARQWRDTIYTVAGKMDYPLDTHIVAISKAYGRQDDIFWSMKYASADVFDTLFANIGYTLKGKTGILAHPSYYDWAYVPDSKYVRITVFPIPFVAGDTIIVDGIAKIEDIMADSTFPGQLPTNYRPMAVLYSASVIAGYKGMPGLSAFYFELFQMWAETVNMTISKTVK